MHVLEISQVREFTHNQHLFQLAQSPPGHFLTVLHCAQPRLVPGGGGGGAGMGGETEEYNAQSLPQDRG